METIVVTYANLPIRDSWMNAQYRYRLQGGRFMFYFFTQTTLLTRDLFVRFYVRVRAYSSYSGGVLSVRGSNLVQVIET